MTAVSHKPPNLGLRPCPKHDVKLLLILTSIEPLPTAGISSYNLNLNIMRHLICIALLLLVGLPAISVVSYIGITQFGRITTPACMIVASSISFMLFILVRDSWRSYKASGVRVVITFDDVVKVLFYILTGSALFALVSSCFIMLEEITIVTLWVFISSGTLLMLGLIGEMLIRRD